MEARKQGTKAKPSCNWYNYKWVAVCLGVLAIVVGVFGYRSSFEDGWSDGYRRGYNQAIIARQGVIYTDIPHIQVEILSHRDISDNITLKYLDDGSGNPGLVVKWDGGVAVAGDNATFPITMIQRFEPWLREATGHYYNVSWEK